MLHTRVQRMNNGTVVFIIVRALHVLHTPGVGFYLSTFPVVHRLEKLGFEPGRAV
jgi:hypothetical protein